MCLVLVPIFINCSIDPSVYALVPCTLYYNFIILEVMQIRLPFHDLFFFFGQFISHTTFRVRLCSPLYSSGPDNSVFVEIMFGEGNGNPLQYSCLENPMGGGAWQAAVHGVAKSRTRLSNFTFTLHFHALEKEMATHSSVLVWRIPGTGEPGRLPSMGSHRVRHN